MARQKKDGTHISCYFDRELLSRLRAYAESKGQTLTTAIERIVKEHLDKLEEDSE